MGLIWEAETMGNGVITAVIAAAALILAGAIPVLIVNNRKNNQRDAIESMNARLGLLSEMLGKLARDQDRHLDWHDGHTQGRLQTRRDD